MTARWVAVVAGLVLIGAACGGGDPGGDDVGGDDPGETVPPPGFDVTAATGDWVLIEADIDGDRLDLGDVRVTIRLTATDVAGSGGCNGYGGEVEFGTDGTVVVGELASTLMACPGPAGEIERAYLRALADATEVMLDDDDRVLVLVSTDSLWTFARDDDGDGEPDADADPLDGAWVAVDLTTRGERRELSDVGARVTVEIDGDRISGTAACNGYAGSLDSDRGRTFGTFVVRELSWTEMGCEPDVMEIEQAFLQALQDVDSYEVADGVYLSSPALGSSIHLVRQAPVADAPVAGTTWRLDTIIQGDAASNLPGMADVVVEFLDDGTVWGATGCRGIAGSWSLDGSSLSVPDIGRIDIPALSDCDDDDCDIDAFVFRVFEGLDLTARVDGRRFTVSARSDAGEVGLSFRAAEASPGADDRTDDATTDDPATEGLDPGGGVDGPVMYAERRDDGGDSMAAEVRGELELDGDCLYVVLESIRYPVLWPFGTRWDPTIDAVVLPGGRDVPLGGDPAGGGGYTSSVAGFTANESVIERAERCAEEPYFEIAVLQSW